MSNNKINQSLSYHLFTNENIIDSKNPMSKSIIPPIAYQCSQLNFGIKVDTTVRFGLQRNFNHTMQISYRIEVLPCEVRYERRHV